MSAAIPDLRSVADAARAKRFVLPAGWIDRKTAAEQLECSEDNVKEVLKAAIELGTIETKPHRVWNPKTRRPDWITAYRVIPQKANNRAK